MIADFHMNVAANLVAAFIFAALVWAWIVHRGGACPLCGHWRDPQGG